MRSLPFWWFFFASNHVSLLTFFFSSFIHSFINSSIGLLFSSTYLFAVLTGRCGFTSFFITVVFDYYYFSNFTISLFLGRETFTCLYFSLYLWFIVKSLLIKNNIGRNLRQFIQKKKVKNGCLASSSSREGKQFDH